MAVKQMAFVIAALLSLVIQVSVAQEAEPLRDLQSEIEKVAPLFIQSYLKKTEVLGEIGVVLTQLVAINSSKNLGLHPQLMLMGLKPTLDIAISNSAILLKLEKEAVAKAEVLFQVALNAQAYLYNGTVPSTTMTPF